MQVEKNQTGGRYRYPSQIYAGNERRQWRGTNRALLGSRHNYHKTSLQFDRTLSGSHLTKTEKRL